MEDDTLNTNIHLCTYILTVSYPVWELEKEVDCDLGIYGITFTRDLG